VAITVHLPSALQPYAHGAGTLRLDAPCATVRDVLSAVMARSPGVVDRVLTETGELREHVNVFVGEENVRFLDGLATRVGDGDAIEIVAAVSGG
jgi:molybdopterin synthase sulfur carrier subunit